MKIEVKKNILARNDTAAAENRERLARQGVCMINLMASPGAGKTSVIMKVIENLPDRYAMAVIEGDIASEIDSLAIEALNIPALQINTGGSCHLTALMISSALDHLDLDSLDLVIVENVGNLVCPAEFDLGETGRVMIASITEGHDKPHKYPTIFREVDAILVNKTDLLPYCDFDMASFRQVVEELNPDGAVIELSCKDGCGTDDWCGWIETAINGSKTRLSS
ncbi:MAG: hydrogenase nickel incorporation protein HypB [Thermoleophilia bacterium]